MKSNATIVQPAGLNYFLGQPDFRSDKLPGLLFQVAFELQSYVNTMYLQF